jgi:glycosyltransferase involved in cell wall biosynthesis
VPFLFFRVVAPAHDLCFYCVSAMPPITAILHTHDDAARLGRALETLRPCDEIVIVDHGSTDATLRVARAYAANIRTATPNQSPASHLAAARYDWALCLLPSESLTEALEASLFEWKLYDARDVADIAACSAFVRQETKNGWTETSPSTRLIPKTWNHWIGDLPRDDQRSMVLQGDLLRFRLP